VDGAGGSVDGDCSNGLMYFEGRKGVGMEKFLEVERGNIAPLKVSIKASQERVSI
jgi:hypothetical protein